MADERRLAICIKGGVSLGAYEAGTLSKTLDLIANNNARGTTPWYVDVLAGASAGSMTSVATACTLLNPGTEQFPSNYLRKMWVAGAQLSALAPDEGPNLDFGYRVGHNLLAASSLDDLAKDFYNPPTITPRRHPALRPVPALIRLIFTLSNLDGDVVRLVALNGESFGFRKHADSSKCDIRLNSAGVLTVDAPDTLGVETGPPISDSVKSWHAMVQAAIASGSFPLAFAQRGLWRLAPDRSNPDRNVYVGKLYSDGGLFDNDPLGKAIALAHEVDWSNENPGYQDNQRKFLVVHTEAADLSEASDRVNQIGDLSPLALAGKLVPAFTLESMQSGLRGLVEVNQQFDQRIAVLNRLARVASANPSAGSPALSPAIQALAEMRKFSLEYVERLKGFLIPDIEDADRVLHDYVTKLPPPAQAAFINLAIFFDLSFNLADKVPIRPILIAPQPDEVLSGNPLFGFAGFFSKTLREFDFARGQYDAFRAWQAVAQNPHNEFTIDGAVAPDPVGTRQPDTGALTSSNEYSNGLDTFKNRLKAVIASAIDELKDEAGPLARMGLDALKTLANLGVGIIDG